MYVFFLFLLIKLFVEINVPIAIIACEGDFKTIKKIAAALEKKIPVIIMKGSGKAADLVLDYLQKYFEVPFLIGFSEYLTHDFSW